MALRRTGEMHLAYTRLNLPGELYLIGLIGTIIVVGIAGVRYILRPALRQVTDRQIALYVEEKIPDLQDRLNSAVEVSDSESLSRDENILIDRLIDDAARKAESIPLTTVVERGSARLLTYGAAIILGLFLIVGFLSLDDLQRAVTEVQQLPTTLRQAPVTVQPGNIEVERGASQEIIAELETAADGNVVLHYRAGDRQWQEVDMQEGLDRPAYLHEFTDIQQVIEYTVEVDDERTGPFTISLYEFPEVRRIDVTYEYPDYAARPVRTEENAGDIRGLKGSTVTVDITTKGSVVNAVLERENSPPVPLERTADHRFQGSFTLETKDFYRIQLTDEEDKQNRFSQEYLIQPVDDEKPFISLSNPGRDIRANAIQEVLVATDVQDDFGVKDVELRYSINGREEQSVPLVNPDSTGRRDISGEHLFFLEEHALEPGDVISYYVEAEDYAPSNDPEVTDMYFIEVMPFDQRFSQVNNAGGGGGAGSQPSETVRSQQQIITATWKLYRHQDEMAADEFQSSLDALVQGQSNLRQNIERRLSSTAFSTELQESEKHQQIVESLRNAVDEMKAAEQQLSENELRAALTPERKALNQLLRAEAANKEQQLALQRGGSPGGGSAAATQERMSELMDLELDISKDKYEMQQRGSSSLQQQRNDALDKIRELAQKQEQLLERRQQELEGKDNKRFVDRLEREQQELQRQAQNLAQQMRKQARQRGEQNRRMEQQLDRITEQMQEAGRSLRRQDMQEARSQQQQALNELQRVQQKLGIEDTDNLRKQLEDFTQGFDQLKQAEETVGDDIREAAAESQANDGQIDREDLRQLSRRQGSLSEEASQLKEVAQNLRERSAAENPELAAKLENLIRRMEQTNLQENVRSSEQALGDGWLDYARRKQDDIDRSLEQLSTNMEAFEEQLPHTQEERLTESLENVRELTDQMREIQQRAQTLRQAQNQSAQNQQQSQDQRAENSSSREQCRQEQQPSTHAQAQGSERAQAREKRLQEDLQRAQQSIDRLREQVNDNPETRRQLDRMESFIRRANADYTGVLLDENAADEFFSQEIYSPLSDLELHLARQLDALAMEKKLYGARRGNVPREYQQLVETYYERLSKSDHN
jgi:hypothetical protein